MPMECGLLARADAATRCARKKIHDACERRASAGIASSRPTKGRKKFFCIIVRNPLPIAPDAVRIARIGGVPIRYSTSRAAIETIKSLENARCEVGDAPEQRRSASQSHG